MQYSICKMIECRITFCIITKSLYTAFQSSVHSNDLVAVDDFSTSCIVLFVTNRNKQRVFSKKI